jgi:hypothetical protein
VRRVQALSEEAFSTEVHPVLMASCATACHQPGGDAAAQPNTFSRNRFVLTGSAEGDYNVTLSMVSDVCNASANALLARPSTVPHPSGALNQATAVLPQGSAGYTAIANWILRGCGAP